MRVHDVLESRKMFNALQFNHTMIRVKDPKVSVKFYTEVRRSNSGSADIIDTCAQVLGMELLSRASLVPYAVTVLCSHTTQTTSSTASRYTSSRSTTLAA